jgi:hypothetical protein
MAMAASASAPAYRAIDGDASALALVRRIEKCIFLGSFGLRWRSAVSDSCSNCAAGALISPATCCGAHPGHAIHRLQDAVP